MGPMFVLLRQIAPNLLWRSTLMIRHSASHTRLISLKDVCGYARDLVAVTQLSVPRTVTSTTRMVGLSEGIMWRKSRGV